MTLLNQSFGMEILNWESVDANNGSDGTQEALVLSFSKMHNLGLAYAACFLRKAL
jgi:hypothetical protein